MVSSTTCQSPMVSPTWWSPARPLPRTPGTAARPACPRWSGYAGRVAASPSSGPTILAGSPPTATSTSASRGRCSSSSPALRRPPSWPASSTPAPPRRSAAGPGGGFPTTSWGSTRRATSPSRGCPGEDRDHRAAGDGHQRATARRLAGIRFRPGARPGTPGAQRARLRRLRIGDTWRRGDRHRYRSGVARRHALPGVRVGHGRSGTGRGGVRQRVCAGAGGRDDIARAARVPIDVYGDAYDAEYAREQIGSRRAQPGVAVHRAVPRASLWAAMARAAVVLYPAQWDEPFGMAAAEAQACGTPVVAFRRGALAEVISDAVTGFLVAPDDISAAAEAVTRTAELSRPRCRDHAKSHLDLGLSLDAHEQLYE